MNAKTFISILFLLICTFALKAQTSLCGSLTTDTTLTLANSPYSLSCDLIVEQGATLTIEPGVSIEIPSNTYDIIVHGKLIANGTMADTIRFFGTGFYKGGSIAFLKAESGSSIRYAVLEQMGVNGGSVYDSGLYLDSTIVSVQNTTFIGNTQADVRATAGSAEGFNNTNQLEIIKLFGEIYQNTTWPDADLDGFYYLPETDIIVPAGITLTIEPNVSVNFNTSTKDLIVHGKLMAEGAPADSIHFYGTGFYKGGSIAFLKAESGSSLSYVIIEEMGNNGSSLYDAGLYLDSTTVSVSNSTFRDNTQGDVRATPNSVSGFTNSNSLNDIEIFKNNWSGMITWPDADANGFFYEIMETVTIPPGSNLTIAPNVDINFIDFDINLIVEGTLTANGTAADSIHIYGTGFYKGGSIAFLQAEAGSSLSHVIIEQMGVNGSSFYDAGLYLDSTTVSVANCTFLGNAQGDVRATANSVGGFANTNSLNDIKIIDNDWSGMTTWPDADADGFYYQILETITVAEDAGLTINPNVDINMPDFDIDLLIYGTLTAEGTATDSIHFYGTGFYKGGTIAFLQAQAGSSLEYVRLQQLGINGSTRYDAALHLDSTTVAVSHCTFLQNTQGDVRATPNSVGGFANTNSLEDIEIIAKDWPGIATWPDADVNGFYYELLERTTVPTGATLQIQPNVAVNFTDFDIDLLVEGILLADGTPADSIHFYGSGFYKGGTLAFLKGEAGSSLSYSTFNQLGVNGSTLYDAAILLDSTTVSISNNTFTNNTRGDVRATANSVGGFENTNSLLDIKIITDTLMMDVSWPDADSSGFYYEPQSDLTILPNVTLTIEPNVAVNLVDYRYDILVEGTLMADGTAQDSILFLGSGNYAGGSIAFQQGSVGSISFAHIDLLGYNGSTLYDAGIATSSSDVTIESCLITRSQRGVSVLDFAKPNILSNTIEQNTNGIYVDFGFPTIELNDIQDNTSYGVWNNPANRIVEACNNYWGDPTGPYHPTVNPTGLGNAISDKVAAPDCLVNLNAKAFLEGPYNGTTMDDDLRIDSLIPANQPYAGNPWSFPYNSRITPSALDLTGNNAVIDWVHLELRDTMDPTIVIAETVGLLQADGDIVEVDGLSPTGFIAPTGSYYLVVDHRNHISAMTAQPVAVSGMPGAVIDLTSIASYGTNGTKLLNGTYLLFQGDAAPNNVVNAADRSTTWNYRNQEAYLNQDVNMDGVCNAADRSNTWNNRNIESQVP